VEISTFKILQTDANQDSFFSFGTWPTNSGEFEPLHLTALMKQGSSRPSTPLDISYFLLGPLRKTGGADFGCMRRNML
jgi:hypothetical protein